MRWLACASRNRAVLLVFELFGSHKQRRCVSDEEAEEFAVNEARRSAELVYREMFLSGQRALIPEQVRVRREA